MKRDYTSERSVTEYERILSDLSLFPFSFLYGGRKYEGFGSEYFESESRKAVTAKNKRTEVVTWLFDVLKITLDYSFYPAYGASEWTVFFENVSDKDSEVISECMAEYVFKGEKPLLRGIYGDHDNWYRPYLFDLEKEEIRFRSDGGRATHGNFPYFDLVCGGGGVMLAIGWAGTWSADFKKTESGTVYRAKSVNSLSAFLKPGEKIRTASFIAAPYFERDEFYAVNYWRSFFTQCIMPASDGKDEPLRPFSTCCLASDTGRPNSDGSISEGHDTWRRSLEKMIEEDVKVDFRWIDAGWYQRPDLGSAEPYVPGKDWWDSVGTWVPDPVKWPGDTLLQSTEFAREHGMKTLMWFEPERITDPENMAKNFGYNPDWAIKREGNAAVSNNIGDPACLEYTTERICRVLRENKIEMYREDNNSDPAVLWAYLDALEGKDRNGITECRFIQGHYEMWDRIIGCTLSFGGCGFVDSCASGGGRNDIESLKRGIPMLRSDSDRTTTAIRLSMTTSFNKWIPFCGANTKEKVYELDPVGNSDPYIWRASYLPALNVDSQFCEDPDQDFGVLRRGLAEWKRVAPYLLKEFYVFTPWHNSSDKSGFTAYAFFDPEEERGVLLAFRQEKCAEEKLNITLPFGRVSLTDEDSGECFGCDGALTLFFETPRCAKLLWIN